MARVDGDEAIRAGTQSARIVSIDHRASGENHDAVLFRERYGQVLPVDQIGTHRMSPTHVAPNIAERVVLVKEMILAFVEDQAVGIVGPIFRGAEVVLRTERLIVALGVT